MRDILFRAKRLDNGKWIYGGYFKHDTVKVCFTSDDPHTKHYIIRDGSCDWGFEPPLEYCAVDPETIGQFADQYDIAGNCIFEGDIVYCDRVDENAEIKWDSETSRFIIAFDDWCADFDDFYGCYIRVIGNIHDNSKLLEEENND